MNKLTADKCREQFEAHIRNLDGDYNLIRVGEFYIDVDTQIKWRTWQAAWNKALEIAPPILEQQERVDDDWIVWPGGNCPIDKNKFVYVKLRNGDVDNGGAKAGTMDWFHFGKAWDIIAYRLVKP